jgi:hypothetical protein
VRINRFERSKGSAFRVMGYPTDIAGVSGRHLFVAPLPPPVPCPAARQNSSSIQARRWLDDGRRPSRDPGTSPRQ